MTWPKEPFNGTHWTERPWDAGESRHFWNNCEGGSVKKKKKKWWTFPKGEKKTIDKLIDHLARLTFFSLQQWYKLMISISSNESHWCAPRIDSHLLFQRKPFSALPRQNLRFLPPQFTPDASYLAFTPPAHATSILGYCRDLSWPHTAVEMVVLLKTPLTTVTLKEELEVGLPCCALVQYQPKA